MENETEGQGGFDREVGVLELPFPPADPSRRPRGDRVRREPERDVASLHEGFVVFRPISARYLVLYFGWTLDFTSRSCPGGRHDGQNTDSRSPSGRFPRTNAQIRDETTAELGRKPDPQFAEFLKGLRWFLDTGTIPSNFESC